MNKANKETFISYEIKAIIITDEGNSFEETKTKNKMVINDVEYNRIKKSLDNKYGIGDHFEDLDNEVKEILEGI